MLTSAPFRRLIRLLIALAVLGFADAATVRADTLTRAQALAIAESYVQHHWSASPRNVRHGRDSDGVEIHRPDSAGGSGNPASDCWVVDAENTGVAYKWGGFDTPSAFAAGVRAGKAAGDVYTTEKRQKGGRGVSGDAVGIDCSGFVSRCWRLPKKESTTTLPGLCQRLASVADLRPADAMNTANGHVLLFVRWLDPDKTRARFYEAAPFSKTRAVEHDIAELVAAGFEPLRYRQIID